MKKRSFRLVVLTVMLLAMCLLATGCMGGQKDISKADEKKYEAIVAEACEEYGYEYDKLLVFPLGAELMYSLTNGDEDILLDVNIDEESSYDKVSCKFEIRRTIDSVDDRTKGMEEHLDVLVAIAEHFTDEITKDVLVEYLNNEDWTAGQGEDEFIMDKVVIGSMNHTINVVDGTAGEYKDGDELEEYFSFWWDNGKKYSFKNK